MRSVPTTAEAKAKAAAKARCWSANSSGIQTTSSSVGSFDSRDSTSDTLRFSALTIDELTAPAARPRGLSPNMMDALVRLADTTSTQLVHEAQASLRTPMKRKHVQLLSCNHGVAMYKSVRPAAPSSASLPSSARQPYATPRPAAPLTAAPVPQREPPKISRSRSLWNRLTKRRARPATTERVAAAAPSINYQPSPMSSVPRSAPTPATAPSASLLPPYVPRIFGVTQVHVPLDELVDIVGHRSAHSTSLVHPSMRATGQRLTLIDHADEHVSVRSVALRPLTSTTTTNARAPREFLVVERHHNFTTSSGRRGFAVVCHSVHWTNCPSPLEGAVRGSLYESGLVAIESAVDADQVDLYCVAEMNLKGGATERANLDASHRRVMGTLERITRTIEERTKMLLSLDHTHVFQQGAHAAPQVCSGCHDRLPASVARGTEPYACRKCYAPVCNDCSSIWQRGQKPMRLCMECWADATLNRTCASARPETRRGDSFVQYL